MRFNKKIFIQVTLVFILLFSILITNKNFYKSDTYSYPAINGDPHQYLAMSLNIYKYNIITHDNPRAKGTPSNYREFIYPLYLSLFYNFLDWKNYSYHDCIYQKNLKHCEEFYYSIFISELFLILVSLLILIYISKNSLIKFLISTSFFLYFIINQGMIFNFSPELISAILLFGLSFFTYELIKKNSIVLYIYSILCFVLLVYIKNIFYYYAVILFFISIFSLFLYFFFLTLFKKDLFLFGNIFFKFLIVSSITLVCILPYQLRNQIKFNNTALTKRGDEVLTIRNEFLKLNYKEIINGFYYYSPNIFGLKNNNKFKKIKKNSFYNISLERSYYRSYNRPHGYVINSFNKNYGTNFSSYEKWSNSYQNQVAQYNIKVYLSNFVKQTLLSTLMFYKGFNYKWDINQSVLETTIFNFIYFFFVITLLCQIFKSFFNKRYMALIIYSPTFYFVFMMSTLTFYEPRMNNTLILILIMSYNYLKYEKLYNLRSYFKK